MKIEYKIAGQICNPVNRENIYLEVNHDQESVINEPKPHVGISNLYFANEDILKIMALIENPPGITEGVPFDIDISERGQTETINMYFDLMSAFKRSANGISLSVKMKESLDHLDDQAEGFTLESMYNETGVNSFIVDGITYVSYQDFFDKRVIFIPYVISTIPNAQNAFMALATIISIAIQWFRALTNIIQQTFYSVGVLTTIPGVLALAAEVAFFALLTVALIALINQMIDSLIQPIKYHGAMLMIDMLKIVAIKMGYTFNSSIWEQYPYNQIAYLPEKYNPQEDGPNTFSIFGIPLNGFQKTGFTNPGYATSSIHDSTTTTIQKGYLNGTGADVIRLAKSYCNGKMIIPDQTKNLLLERRDYNLPNSTYQLPDIRQDWNGYNTDELSANILIRFSDDLNDKNCIDKYIGTIFQATHKQIISNDQSLINLKGLKEKNIRAARGVNKKKLSFIEKLVNSISFIFSGQNYNNRFDCLLLENDMVTTPKFLLVDLSRSDFTDSGGFSGQKRIAYLRNDNPTVINAQWCWDKFYYIDAFVGTDHNRFTKISPALNSDSDKNPTTLSLSNFKSLVSNPKFNDNFGEEVIADSIQWYIEKNGQAFFEFRKRGWLKNPQSNDGATRAQEININLQLNTSLPNGQ